MNEKNCDILFEYLRGILYGPKIEHMNIEELDEPFQKLGKGLQYLEYAVDEMKRCTEALSRGNLADFTPSRTNPLCENLKNIHANLTHLTWQAKQVAKGDYSQNVSYLGEFSEAFNTMIHQLQEREEFLKQEAKMEKAHANMVESYNLLLLDIIKRSKEEILITSIEKEEILYATQNYEQKIPNEEIYQIFLEKLQRGDFSQETEKDSPEWVWEVEDCANHFYHITTGLMEWQGEKSYAHIILNITEEKKRQKQLESKAHLDMLTQIGNRLYFEEHMKMILKNKVAFSLCYCDLDHLKQINDQHGHLEGDAYIRGFVETVKRYIREKDIFARIGGDEFCIVLIHCPYEIARVKMMQIQEDFIHDTEKEYEKNFSFGIIDVPEDSKGISLKELLHKADEEMYEQKRTHKGMRSRFK